MIFFQKNDFKIFLGLAIPLMLSGIVESSIGFTSNIFLAHIGPVAFGSGSLVIWFFATLMVIVWGIFTAVSILVSRYDGANDTKAISLVLRDSIALGVLLVIPISILIYNMSPVLIFLGQKPFVVARALPYLHALSWSVLPDFLSLILQQFIIGLGRTRVNLLFTSLAVPVNVGLSYILIFGKLGFPGYGIAWLGCGTTAAFSVLTVVLFGYLLMQPACRKYLQGFKEFSKPIYLVELIKVGLPIGLMFCLEVGFFFAMELIMGNKGVNELAANQLAMQYVAFFSTLTFTIAQAVTVRMGNQLGANHPDVANRAAYVGIIFAFGFTLVAACLEWFFPNVLIKFDFNPNQLHNKAMFHVAVGFLAIAAVFQLMESVRLTLFGALRALKDTRFTLLISFIAFWCIAIPFGYVFSNYLNFGIYGYWWALAMSAFFNTVLMYWRYRNKMKASLVEAYG